MLKLRKSKLLPDSEYLLPICFVILSIFVGLNFLILLFLTHRVNYLSQRKNTFVQLVNGEAIAISEKDVLYRQPEVIKHTVRQWATLTFDWNGRILDTQKIDQGYEIGSGKKITTNAYYGSFLIESGESGFRQEALNLIAEITPSQIFSGEVRSKIVIQHISPPREIATGLWEVDLISTRLLVYIPRVASFSDTSSFEQRVYAIRQSGLEITKIVDYQR